MTYGNDMKYEFQCPQIVLLEHSHIHSVYGCFSDTMVETIWPTMPKMIFTIWPFTEKVCQPLSYREKISSQSKRAARHL